MRLQKDIKTVALYTPLSPPEFPDFEKPRHRELEGAAANLFKFWKEWHHIEENWCPERQSNSPKITQLAVN